MWQNGESSCVSCRRPGGDRGPYRSGSAAQDLLVLPGGMLGTTNLGNHAGMVGEIRKFYEEGKKIAAICAAPYVFGQMGILKGREATCYPGWSRS